MMTCYWCLLFQLLGIWKKLKDLFRDPDLGLILLTMITLLIFFGLVYVSGDRLIELGHKKRYLCSKGNPVDKSGLVVLVVMCFVFVVGCVIFFSK
jgi:hypothetical protein